MKQPHKATFLIYSNGKAVIVEFKYIDKLDNLLSEFMYLIGETLCIPFIHNLITYFAKNYKSEIHHCSVDILA